MSIVITQDADTTIEVTSNNTMLVANLTVGNTVPQNTNPRWATKVIASPESVSTDDNFKKNIAAILYIDNVLYDWELLGAVQDKDAGTIDWSACSTFGGEVSGTMRYQYWD